MIHQTRYWFALAGVLSLALIGCEGEDNETTGVEPLAAEGSLVDYQASESAADETEGLSGEPANTESTPQTLPSETDEAASDDEELDNETGEPSRSEDTGETDPTEALAEENADTGEQVDEELTEAPVSEEESTEETNDSPVVFMPLSDTEDVVEFVQIDRYMGTWYEIATTPSFQQAFCYGTTANYTFNETQGEVEVVNTCYNGSLTGPAQNIAGKAQVVDEETQAKLAVFFFGQGAPYWVVALDGSEGEEPYAWAVVSVPGGQTMWLLSRTPTMEPEIRAAIEGHLEERGFPVGSLIDTPQGT